MYMLTTTTTTTTIKIKHKFTQKVLFKGSIQNLNYANLQDANLRNADLRNADLQGADLQGANLQGANLQGANLHDANLQCADLWNADLQGANLRTANLQGANLQGANLQGANLWYANLRNANLQDANLRNADLRNADLQGADLQGANLPPFFTCPQEGSFIAWKKISNKLIKLRIPAKAKRTSPLVGRKCRAEYCTILGIYELTGAKTNLKKIRGGYKNDEYIVGQIFYPDRYDSDIRVECTHGVHFFITKEEAINYC